MARSTTDPRLTFVSLYEDPLSGLTKEYQVRYYLDDGSIDIGDTNTRKAILKRTSPPSGSTLSRSDFVLGSKVAVFGRLLHLVRYADAVTQQLCEGGSAGDRAQPAAGDVLTTARLLQGGGAIVKEVRSCDTMYVVLGGRQLSMVGTALSVLEVELGFTISGITAGTLPARDVAAVVSELTKGGGGSTPYPHVDGRSGIDGSEAWMQTTQFAASQSIGTLSQEKAFKNNMVVVVRASKPGTQRFVSTVQKRLESSAPGGVWVCATNSMAILLGGSVISAADSASLNGAANSQQGGCPPHIQDALSAGPAAEGIFASVEQRAARHFRGPSGASAAEGGVVLIKPHVLKAKESGLVVQELLEGVSVVKPKPLPLGRHAPHPSTGGPRRAVLGGLSKVALGIGEVSRMLAPYRGVLENFSEVAAEVASGPMLVVYLTTQEVVDAEVALCAYSVDDALRAARGAFEMDDSSSNSVGRDAPLLVPEGGSDVVGEADIFSNLRELCGPHDPAIARLLRSRSLRARYGKTAVENAVHCTDLAEDVEALGTLLLGHAAVRRAAPPTDGCA